MEQSIGLDHKHSATFWHPQKKEKLNLLHVSMQPDTSPLPTDWREHDLEESFHSANTDDDLHITKIRIPELTFLPAEIEQYDGVVIGGSSFNIADNLVCFGKVREVIRKAIDQSIPMLGYCFGHQMIADELGGTVERGAIEPEIAVITIQKTAAGKTHRLFQGMPEVFSVPSNHADIVTTLPQGSVELAENVYPNQAVEYQRGVYGVQFHPERSKRTMRAIFMNKLSGQKQQKTLSDLDALDRTITDQIQSNFLTIMREKA